MYEYNQFPPNSFKKTFCERCHYEKNPHMDKKRSERENVYTQNKPAIDRHNN